MSPEKLKDLKKQFQSMVEVPTWETELEKLDSGLFAYIQEEGTWFKSNVGLIVGDNEAIVIDSLTGAEMVENFKKKIKEVTDKPIRFLINTHFHGDHTYTNHHFPKATTISDKTTREQILKASPDEIELYSEIWSDIDFSDAKITPPDMTFEKKATLFQGGREIQLVSVGPAHTASDSFVYLPGEKIVFCGDLLFHYCSPFALMGHIPGYIQAITRLTNIGADTYVPGHGPVSGEEGLYKAREYLELIRDTAYEGFKEGLSYFEAAKKMDLGEFEKWGNPERVVGNFARAYSEFRGEPAAKELDYGEIISKMLEYGQ